MLMIFSLSQMCRDKAVHKDEIIEMYSHPNHYQELFNNWVTNQASLHPEMRVDASQLYLSAHRWVVSYICTFFFFLFSDI